MWVPPEFHLEPQLTAWAVAGGGSGGIRGDKCAAGPCSSTVTAAMQLTFAHFQPVLSAPNLPSPEEQKECAVFMSWPFWDRVCAKTN